VKLNQFSKRLFFSVKKQNNQLQLLGYIKKETK